ncbi:UTRA domain-containing protein [Novosphingobium sp.]|uniref:UTRA domain-containing protein n=1 Tax=Novosphingobium sp. TaxID=1874826 RepID=UPI0031DE595F
MTQDTPAKGMRARIADHVIARITSGEWQAGERIPSESALTASFGVSRMTVHHALRDLTTRGFLVRRSGSGTYVAEPGAYVAEYGHLDIIEEIVARGGRHRAEVLRRDLRPATPVEAEAFAMAAGQPIFHAQILHYEDGKPLELEDRLIAPAFLPDAMAIDLSAQTLFSRLMLVRPHREGSESVCAVMGSREERTLLQMDSDIPCLKVSRKTWCSEGVVTVASMLRPGDRARMDGRIRSMVGLVQDH